MKFLKVIRGFFLPILMLVQIPKLLELPFLSVDFLLIVTTVLAFAAFGFIGGMEFYQEHMEKKK